MAEKTIQHLIEVTKQENAESRGVTQEVASEVSALSTMFGKYFKDLKNQSGDRLEAEREKKDAPSASPLPDLSKLMGDTKGFGFLGLIAGITGAIAGLVAGVVQGFTDVLRMVMGPVLKGLAFITRGIGKFFLGYGKATLKLLTKALGGVQGKILQGFFRGVGLGVDGKPTTRTNKLVKGLYRLPNNLTKALSNFSESFKKFGSTFGKRLKVNFKLFTRGFGRGLKSLMTSLTTVGNKLFKPFMAWGEDISKLGKMIGGQGKKSAGIISKIGGFFKSFGSIFGKFFTIFRTLGRVIFFPITIIMTMVDAFNGFKEGFANDGIIGGVLGAISGVLIGLIGMPLDLIKSAVSWIAGKMGFENFSETLDAFSFSDMIGNLFGAVTDTLTGFMDGIKDDFANMSFAGAIGELGKKLFNIVTSIMKFPLAVVAGGAAALGALLPGGKSPMEAFGDAFSAVMSFGTFKTNTAEKIEGKKETRKNREEKEAADLQKPTSKEQSSDSLDVSRKEAVAAESASSGSQIAINAGGNTTNNTSSSSAVAVVDASPATDDLDRVAA